MRLILLGAPGSGKGTATGTLLKKFGVKHISTGDIFRENIKNKTPLGEKISAYLEKGELVPDETTIEITLDRLGQDDLKDGFILDGFPRTITQAKSLDDFLKNRGEGINKVLYFKASVETLINRITGRMICESCGAIYHKTNIVPKVDGVCDKCGGSLITRKDDNEETARKRINVYNEETLPLIDFYKNEGLLLELDANSSAETVSTFLENYSW